ncbi:MAG: MBL fold metallo-hydrolase [Jatrophihabitantaceae bacterium]
MITEPYTDPLVRGNIWHVRGRDRDLVVDAGLGVAALRDAVPDLFANDPALVITHAHLDHMGSAYEFADCWAHPLEPVANPLRQTLRGAQLVDVLGIGDSALTEPPPDLLVAAVPYRGYDPANYELRSVRVTRELNAGDVIDLGDRRLRVLHLPGHTPGSIALYEPDTRALFSGDVIYDVGGADQLLDDLGSGDVGAYLSTMGQLEPLPIDVIYAGHGDPFGADRMHELIEEYRRTRARPVR